MQAIQIVSHTPYWFLHPCFFPPPPPPPLTALLTCSFFFYFRSSLEILLLNSACGDLSLIAHVFASVATGGGSTSHPPLLCAWAALKVSRASLPSRRGEVKFVKLCLLLRAAVVSFSILFPKSCIVYVRGGGHAAGAHLFLKLSSKWDIRQNIKTGRFGVRKLFC